jgi:AraC family transcriptional regulator
MMHTERTTAEALEKSVPGRLIATGKGRAWKDLLVQIFSRNQVQDSIIIPAVPEPLIVWVLSGAAIVEERELGGVWKANKVITGDFFLTTSPSPCELRWQTTTSDPFEVMHLYLGLPLVKRAIKDVLNEDAVSAGLREVSGESDEVLSALLEQLRLELTARHRHSAVFVQGISQCLAVHLVRTYSDPNARRSEHRGGLPAFKLQKVTSLLEQHLHEEFSLARLARAAGLSEFHFSRAFKQSTGFSPSSYFIRMRMEKARLLLRETPKTVIEVGLDIGYSSPSHFAQVFRREVGVSPTEYRDGL